MTTIRLNLRLNAPMLARRSRGASSNPALKSQFGRTMMHASAQASGLTDDERGALARIAGTASVDVDDAGLALAVFGQSSERFSRLADGYRQNEMSKSAGRYYEMSVEWSKLEGVVRGVLSAAAPSDVEGRVEADRIDAHARVAVFPEGAPQ